MRPTLALLQRKLTLPHSPCSIAPSLFEPFLHAPVPAEDEWTLSLNLGERLGEVLEQHYKTFIVSSQRDPPRMLPDVLLCRPRKTSLRSRVLASTGFGFLYRSGRSRSTTTSHSLRTFAGSVSWAFFCARLRTNELRSQTSSRRWSGRGSTVCGSSSICTPFQAVRSTFPLARPAGVCSSLARPQWLQPQRTARQSWLSQRRHGGCERSTNAQLHQDSRRLYQYSAKLGGAPSILSL